MLTRPEINHKYRTISGETAQITEQLGVTGYGGYILGINNHFSVWNSKGENQEYVEWDLKEVKSASNSN